MKINENIRMVREKSNEIIRTVRIMIIKKKLIWCVEFLKGTRNNTEVRVPTRKNKRNYAYREGVA